MDLNFRTSSFKRADLTRLVLCNNKPNSLLGDRGPECRCAHMHPLANMRIALCG